MIPCAYLRVFSPLHSFPPEERSQWQGYIESGGPPPARRPAYRDAPTEKERHVGLLASLEGEHADVRRVDGIDYVCPWRTRLRILAGMISLRESGPPEMVDAFVPETEAKRAARELARLKRRHPSEAPAMLQSPWHVPVRWFVLVDDEERRLVESESGEFRLSYWTPLSTARRRAERALQILRRSELAPIGEPIRELAEWLSGFPTGSVVELDYGAVSSLFTWDELDNDHSGRDIQEAIEAVGRPGGMPEAAELYQAVSNRWAEALNHESLN
ncbi:MAG TPA: hypothetical protein VF986_06375 [Actinomycetota bacterium]